MEGRVSDLSGGQSRRGKEGSGQRLRPPWVCRETPTRHTSQPSSAPHRRKAGAGEWRVRTPRLKEAGCRPIEGLGGRSLVAQTSASSQAETSVASRWHCPPGRLLVACRLLVRWHRRDLVAAQIGLGHQGTGSGAEKQLEP